MRTKSRTRSIVIWTLVAVIGAVAWGVIALVRDEQISAAWLIAAAVGSYAIAYRFYARFITKKVLEVDDKRATPAERLENDMDYQPTDRRVLFGHHFAAIAGAGPLVGPVLAAQMGYLPGTIWIIVGVIFAGAVQDMVILFFSMRRDGKSLGQMARDEIGPVGGIAALVAVFSIMIILLAVLALVVVNALAESPWATFSLAMTIPIAIFMGFYLRVLRPGRVMETTAIGVSLLLLAIVAGGWVQESSLAETFTLSPETLTVCLVVYGFFASVLPVWMLLTPRDYLSTFMKIGTIMLLAVGILVTLPVMKNEAVTTFASNGEGPVFAGRAVPVRVHHHRLRRPVRLPRPDRLRHDAEDDREGAAGPLHRLRRDADGVVRRRDGDHRRLDHRPGHLLRDERAGRRAGRHRAVRVAGGQRPRLRDDARVSSQAAAASVDEETVAVPHRRRSDAGLRHGHDLLRRDR